MELVPLRVFKSKNFKAKEPFLFRISRVGTLLQNRYATGNAGSGQIKLNASQLRFQQWVYRIPPDASATSVLLVFVIRILLILFKILLLRKG